jgi:hypothetical protein
MKIDWDEFERTRGEFKEPLSHVFFRMPTSAWATYA